MHYFDQAHGVWMLIWWLLLAVLAAAVVGWIVSSARRSKSGGNSAEAELKRRYARGELTQEEYQRMLEELRPSVRR